MLRQYQQLQTRFHQVVDAGLFMLAFWAAHALRSQWPVGGRQIEPFTDYLWLWVIIVAVTPVILEGVGFYKRQVIASRRARLLPLVKTCVLVPIISILVLFFYKEQLARSVFPLFGVLAFLLVTAKEELVQQIYRSKFGRNQLNRRVLLIGSPQGNADLRSRLQAAGGIEIVAEMDLRQHSLDEFVQVLHERSANGVIINAGHTYFDQVEKVIRCCEIEGIETWVVADFFRTETFRLTGDDLLGLPVLVFRSAPETNWAILGKQLVDIFGALVGLVFLSPLIAVIAITIRFTSPGPVLFRQQRSGLNGRPFTMLKFRTMQSDAEQRQHELARLNEMSGPVFKVANDPRVTPVGRWLRKWSLDELPQLWNVLTGEMSLVGPRPLPVHEVKRFDDFAHRRRLSVKPGLTCLWQISGRNEISDFQTRVKLDLQYIDNWSFWLDMQILAKTIPAVLRGTGAK